MSSRTVQGTVWLEPPPQDGGFRGRAARGAGVSSIAQLWRLVLQVGSTLVLARMLSPEEFGLVGMVLAVTALADQLKDAGLANAVVQRRDLRQDQVSALFWVNAAIGVGLTAVVASLAPVLAWFYGRPELVPLTLGLSLVYTLGGLAVQHNALLLRRMRYSSVAARDAIAQTAGVAAALTAATLGAGTWSLVVLHLVAAAVRTVVVWTACSWRPGRPALRVEGVRELLTFGGDVTGFTVLNYLARNADNVLIGRFVGASALGLYGRAYSLVLVPLQQVSQPLGPVMLSTLARLRDEPARFRSAWVAGLSRVALVGLPLVAVLVCVVDVAVPLVLGRVWAPSAPLFQVLAVAGAAQLVGASSGWLYMSTGRTRAMLTWALWTRPVVVLSFVVGLAWGPVGVASAYAVVTVVLLVPGMLNASRDTPVRLSDGLGAVWRPAVVAGAAAVGCLGGRWLGEGAGQPAELAAGLVGAACLTGLLVLAWPSVRSQVLVTVAAVRSR